MRKLLCSSILLVLALWGSTQIQIQVKDSTFITPSRDTVSSHLVITTTTTTSSAISSTFVVKPFHGTIPPPGVKVFNPAIISATIADLVAQRRGSNQFYSGNGQQSPIPTGTGFQALDNDYRFDWGTLQTGVGTYDFSSFDAVMTTCTNNGWQLSFRIVTYDPGFQGCPSFVNASTTNAPDVNSELYLTNFNTFLGALYTHIGANKKKISGWDISGIGTWSEWHHYSMTRPIYPTVATCRRIVDMFTTQVPDIPLFALISAFQSNSNVPVDGAAYLINTHNSFGNVGIRDDHLGDKGNADFDTKQNTQVASDGTKLGPAVLARWQTAEVKGELLNNMTNITTGGGGPYWDMSNEVKLFHLSQFSNSNEARRSGSGATAAQIAYSDVALTAASKLSGYRLYVTSVSVSGSQIITSWKNDGVAPVYQNWNVTYEVRTGSSVTWSVTSTWHPRLFLPGTTTSTDTISSGVTGRLYVIIKDPNAYCVPLVLANTNRQSDGAYIIGDL